MANHPLTPRAAVTSAGKRRRLSDDHHNPLLPGLPDHISHLCLSLVSPSALYSVCRSWRRHLYSASFPPFRSLYTLSIPTTAAANGGAHGAAQMLKLSSFDPISSKWITVDSPPLPPYLRHLPLRHPSFISPIQSLSVAGNLLIIAATAFHHNLPIPAFPHPIIFNPLSNSWSSCPPLSTARRWCAAGALRDTVVVASGIGSHYTETTARSVEKWVFRKTESFHKIRQDSSQNRQNYQSLNGDCENTQFLNHPFHKNQENHQSSNEDCDNIHFLKHPSHKSQENHQFFQNSFEINQETHQSSNGDCENIHFLNHPFHKNQENHQNLKNSFEKNLENIQSLYKNCKNIEFLKHPFDKNQENHQSSNGKNCEKFESLKHSFVTSQENHQSSNGNCEKIESCEEKWETMRSLKHSKLCREAIEAIGWKGKLCMVNVKGDYTKQGFVYNLDSDEWSEMPEGMLGGWRGPAAAMAEETLYVVDESRGVLRRYDEGGDEWSDVVVDERLKGAEYMAAGGGRVCVVGGKDVGVVVVDVVAATPRVWVVETPVGCGEVVAVHVLPRVGSPEF